MSSASPLSKRSQTTATVHVLHANIIGLAAAGFIMAFFGAAWWGWALGGIQGAFSGETGVFFSLLALATIILVSGGHPVATSSKPFATRSIASSEGSSLSRREAVWQDIWAGLWS
jgi:hypothetical protein